MTCKTQSESQDSTGEQVPFEQPWRSHSTAIFTDSIAQDNRIANTISQIFIRKSLSKGQVFIVPLASASASRRAVWAQQLALSGGAVSAGRLRKRDARGVGAGAEPGAAPGTDEGFLGFYWDYSDLMGLIIVI